MNTFTNCVLRTLVALWLLLIALLIIEKLCSLL